METTNNLGLNQGETKCTILLLSEVDLLEQR